MRLHRSLILLAALIASVLAGSVIAQDAKPVADRLAAQNALFDEQYESDLRNFPERATAFGDYRYNDKLKDYSLAAITQRHRTDGVSSAGCKRSRPTASPTRINFRTTC